MSYDDSNNDVDSDNDSDSGNDNDSDDNDDDNDIDDNDKYDNNSTKSVKLMKFVVWHRKWEFQTWHRDNHDSRLFLAWQQSAFISEYRPHCSFVRFRSSGRFKGSFDFRETGTLGYGYQVRNRCCICVVYVLYCSVLCCDELWCDVLYCSFLCCDDLWYDEMLYFMS